MNIEFSYSNENYRVFDEKRISSWLKEVIRNENLVLGEINYSIVSDQEILEVNRKYLNHDYFTDIITFDNSFVNIINGDIFVSFETVQSNSEILKIQFLTELFRVIVHGIMHLCGYDDGSDKEKEDMRKLEDKYIAYLEKL